MGKVDYTAMAKEMAAAKQVMDDYRAGVLKNVWVVEAEYKKRTGKFRCYATIKKYSEGMMD